MLIKIILVISISLHFSFYQIYRTKLNKCIEIKNDCFSIILILLYNWLNIDLISYLKLVGISFLVIKWKKSYYFYSIFFIERPNIYRIRRCQVPLNHRHFLKFVRRTRQRWFLFFLFSKIFYIFLKFYNFFSKEQMEGYFIITASYSNMKNKKIRRFCSK